MKVKKIRVLETDGSWEKKPTKILVNGKYEVRWSPEKTSNVRIFLFKDKIIKLDASKHSYSITAQCWDTIDKWKKIAKSGDRKHFLPLLSWGRTRWGKVRGLYWVVQKNTKLRHQMADKTMRILRRIARKHDIYDVGGPYYSTHNCAIRLKDNKPVIYDFGV